MKTLTAAQIALLMPAALDSWDETRDWDEVAAVTRHTIECFHGTDIAEIPRKVFLDAWWDRHDLFWSKEYGRVTD